MFEIENIIQIIDDKLKINLSVRSELIKKKTARSLQKYILVDENSKKYLLEIATNSIEIFYFKRTIEYQNKFNNLKNNFKLNLPLFLQIGNKSYYALYEYFDNITFINDDKPIQELNEFYKRNSHEIVTTDKNIDKILNNFLSAWPNQFHSMIKRQSEFQEYRKELQKYKSLKIAFEHGDFTTNNIVNDLYLIDFEFARDFQPIGFDCYDYAKSISNMSKYKDSFFYENLHAKKYLLIEKINKKIDSNDITMEIYDNIQDQVLKENWNYLYNVGANYNLSYDWCKIWIKYFKTPKQNIFIFTIWNDSALVFLSPMYRQNNNLYLIGSNPDLFDSFSFLYIDEKYIKQFYDFIFKSNYNIDFRYLDADSNIAKILIKYLYQNRIKYESEIVDAKPKTYLNLFKFKTKEKSDIKRLKNRAKTKYLDDFKFEYSLAKDDSKLNEFINMHKERWNGGPFVNINKFDLFIKEISQTDLVVLSSLSIKNNTVAYHFAYLDSNCILNSAIPSYSNKYNDISPGKVLLYELITYCKDNDQKVFDFGRGAEEYKYWFSNESTILFHIRTYSHKNIFKYIQNLTNKIFNKLYSFFYV